MKRVKITEKQTINNRAAKSEMKTTIRRFDEALQAGDAVVTEKTYLTAVSTVDHAAAKGLIHKKARNGAVTPVRFSNLGVPQRYALFSCFTV